MMSGGYSIAQSRRIEKFLIVGLSNILTAILSELGSTVLFLLNGKQLTTWNIEYILEKL